MESHNVNPTLAAASSDTGGIIQIGSYIYVFTNDATNIICTRFLAADLTGEQVMTVPTVAENGDLIAWTDGIFAYLISANASTTSRKWSISGTTMTAVSTASVSGLSSGTSQSMFDGTSIYVGEVSPTSSAGININKLTAADGSAKTTTSKILGIAESSIQLGSILLNIDTTRMYIGFIYANWNKGGAASEQSTNIRLIPITKP